MHNKNEIEIAVNSENVISITLLENLQDEFKTLSDQNYQKLKNEILLDGFSFAVHVYEDPASGKIFIVDGHQRVECLRRMKEEGYKIPQIPIVFVKADNLDHAKKKVLAAASQYGTFNQIGAENFIKTIGNLDFKTIENYSLPFLNFDLMDLGLPDEIIVSSHLRSNPNNDWSDEEISGLTDTDKEFYSKKIATPIYEPTGEKPSINDLIDLNKYRSLCSEIEKTSLNKDEKEFLILAASRHIVFNYEKIANYYAHCDKNLQELFEKSALVIIDFNKAVENGFIKLSKEINEYFINDLEKNNENLSEGLTI